MKNILFVDASLPRGILALRHNGQLQSRAFDARFASSSALAPLAQELLAGIRPDAIAYGEGPGSYTGLRSAACFALGLAMGFQCPLHPISLFAGFGAICLFDARSGGFWAWDGSSSCKISLAQAAALQQPLISPQAQLVATRLGRPVTQVECDLDLLFARIGPQQPNIRLSYA